MGDSFHPDQANIVPDNASTLSVSLPHEDRIPVHPADTKGILLGPYGIRAGWSVLLFFFILSFTIFVTLAGLTAYRTVKHGTPPRQTAAVKRTREPKPPGSVLQTHGSVIAYILPVSLLMAYIERRRFGVYGLGGQGRLADCLKGMVAGLVFLSLLVGTLWTAHLLVFDGRMLGGKEAVIYGLKWFAAFCLVGFTEEFMFRGYLQYTLTRGFNGILPQGNRYRRLFGFMLSALLLSGGFLLGHTDNPGESPVGLLAVFVVGMVLAYSLWRTGSLWWAIGFHATWDWAQSFLYGVGDSGTISQGRLFATHPQGNVLYSGGLTGPEGSLFVLPVVLLLAILIRYTLPKRPQPPFYPEKWPIHPTPLVAPAEPA